MGSHDKARAKPATGAPAPDGTSIASAPEADAMTQDAKAGAPAGAAEGKSIAAAPEGAAALPLSGAAADFHSTMREGKFRIGEVVRHKHFPFRGVVFDVDPVFDNTEEWWLSIPEEIRPHKDQPFYHLLAENADSEYVAYVSEQNLERDFSEEPVRHPKVNEALTDDGAGGWRVRRDLIN